MMENNIHFPKGWEDFFNNIKNKDYFKRLINFLNNEYSNYVCYPSLENIFLAFSLCKPKDIKVVIIGQDPYHEPNQAHGLAFSVLKRNNLPPSLINIYKEIEKEYHIPMDYHDGDLSYLAYQGVFLINTILSVRKGFPLSHNISEYEELMKDLFKYLNYLNKPIVYMLWGNFAQKYSRYITNNKAYIIINSHPSPLAANRGGWFDCHQFLSCNQFLKNNNIRPICWTNNKLL